MNKEKRQKNITIMAGRLTEKGADYQKVESEGREAAGLFGVDEMEVRILDEYTDAEQFVFWTFI